MKQSRSAQLMSKTRKCANPVSRGGGGEGSGFLGKSQNYQPAFNCRAVMALF